MLIRVSFHCLASLMTLVSTRTVKTTGTIMIRRMIIYFNTIIVLRSCCRCLHFWYRPVDLASGRTWFGSHHHPRLLLLLPIFFLMYHIGHCRFQDLLAVAVVNQRIWPWEINKNDGKQEKEPLQNIQEEKHRKQQPKLQPTSYIDSVDCCCTAW